MLICVIYSIIDNYVCIDYLDCQSKKLSVICMDKISGQEFYQIHGYCHSRFFIEFIVVSWFHEENKSYCHIIMSFVIVGIIFFKRGLLC